MKKANDENSKGEKVSCEMCDKLEKYKILYQAYADEIKNLWQRSIFLGAFMTLAWGGYGALQLKILDKEFEVSLGYLLMSIGLCWVIIILSLLWIAMAKGSKFVQEAHEEHINDLKFDKISNKRLFCDLDNFDSSMIDLNPNLFYGEVLKAYRYSPSKINIMLGYVSYCVAMILSLTHIFVALCYADKLFWYYILITTLVALATTFTMIAFISCLIQCGLKGKTQNEKKKNNKGEKMTNFNGGAIVSFMTNSTKYPFTLLYDKDGFFVACGEDSNHPNQLNIGVNSSGSSNQNWLIMPYEIALPFLRSLIGTQSHIPDRDAKIVSAINALMSQFPISKDSDILYPYDSPNGQQTILYSNDTFLVASGYDKRDNPNGVQKVLGIGVRWTDKAYPIGPNSRKPQWFCLTSDLTIDFLKNLLNIPPNSVEFIDTNAINQAIQKLTQQTQIKP